MASIYIYIYTHTLQYPVTDTIPRYKRLKQERI